MPEVAAQRPLDLVIAAETSAAVWHSTTVSGAKILDDLTARGLVQDATNLDALRARLEEGPITVYAGFDPTADSLHVGNLIGLLTLRRFQLAGHRPIALAGGATGMIGDPGGKSEERNLITDDQLAANLEGIVPQLRQFLDFDAGPSQARLIDNRSWTVAMSAIDFLRDVGKHVTVNQMMAKESVKGRLAGGGGISFTEFSYMLLQANDFVNLHELEGCELQVGGSDQWGNISLGVDLVRRRRGKPAHGLTWPLLTRADGSKYGKTAGGETMWLSAERLSAYRFYQGWVSTDDGEVRRLLAQLTLLSLEDIDAIVQAHEQAPQQRRAQQRLARELTEIVHGEDAAATAEAASEVLFGRDLGEVTPEALETLVDEVPTLTITGDDLGDGLDPVDLLARTDLAKSKGEARRILNQNGFSLNNVRLAPDRKIEVADLLVGRYLLLRRGKSTHQLVVIARDGR